MTGPAALLTPSASLTVRTVEHAADWRRIEQLRDLIYVRTEGRISGVDDFTASFDRYNSQSRWFIAIDGEQPLGTAKVITDGPGGLPFEDIAGPQERGPDDVLVEIGHLLSLPGDSAGTVVRALLRAAFAYCVDDVGATHIAGDVFLDRSRGDAFYRHVGFEPLYGPYRDPRFLDTPMSMVVLLRVSTVAPMIRAARGARLALLRELAGACQNPEIAAAIRAPVYRLPSLKDARA